MRTAKDTPGRSNTRRRLPDQVAEAMKAVLDYLWQEEAQDYLARGQEEQEGHIFLEMLLIRQWLMKGRTTLRQGER